LAATVGPLAVGFGYKSNEVSYFGGAFIFLGLTGSFIHAILLDKFK